MDEIHFTPPFRKPRMLIPLYILTNNGFLGSPAVLFYPFWGGSSPAKIDYRKEGTLMLTSLQEDLVRTDFVHFQHVTSPNWLGWGNRRPAAGLERHGLRPWHSGRELNFGLGHI